MVTAASCHSTSEEVYRAPFDPVFSAIGRYERAEAGYWTARLAEQRKAGRQIWVGDANYPVLNRLAEAWERQRDRLRNTKPRTIGGIVALAAVIVEGAEDIESDFGEGGETLSLIRGLYDALVTLAAGGAQ